MSGAASAQRIVGREAERAALRDALDRVFSGRTAVVTVEGEAGIGKSTILSGALAAAAARGAHVVSGGAEELERHRPFGMWIDALDLTPTSADPRRAEIAALLTTATRAARPITVSSDAGLQFQVVDAVVDLVEDLAHRRPLVIGLDDLHWADPASLLTLTVLTRRLAGAPVAVITCRRLLPALPDLERTLARLDAAGAVTLRLDGLSDDAVVDLVGQLVAAPPDARLVQEVSGAGGNPLLVAELLAAFATEGAIAVREGRTVLSTAAPLPGLRLSTVRNLGLLPAETLSTLRPASVLGRRFAVTDLATTTGRPVVDLATALEPAMAARVLVEDGQWLRFRHDLIRDAVYADLPQGVRRGLHREAASRLSAAGAPSLVVAEQLSRGAEAGDADAVDGLVGAAREVASQSPAAAAGLLARAIELIGPGGPERDRLLAERVTGLWWAGELTAVEQECRALLADRRDPEVEQTARLCLARTLIMTGRMAEALPELDRVASSGGPSARAAALGWASVARGSIGDLDGAETAARAALVGAERAGEPVVAGVALNSLAAVAEHRGDPAGALRILDDAVGRADRSPARVGHRYPLHVTRGHVLLELDELPRARATLETGRILGERLGTRWALPSYEVFLAVERFLAGEWDDAIAGLETGFALAEETGERYSLVFGLSVLAVIRLHRGDLGRAEEALDQADRELRTGGPAFRDDRVGWARALLLEAQGALDQAFEVLAAAFHRCADSGRVVEFPVLGPDLVRLAVETGDRASARRVADAVDLTAGRDIPPWDAAAMRCRGLLTADAALLTAAVDAGAGRPLHLATTAEDAAAASPDPSTACVLLERAAEAWAGLGATRGVDRVDAALRDRGVRRGRRGRRARPRTGWDSLTPTERRVVALVAEGLSNPQIGDRLYLSRRTVQTHVGHVFGKLGLSSRAELAAAAARRAD